MARKKSASKSKSKTAKKKARGASSSRKKKAASKSPKKKTAKTTVKKKAAKKKAARTSKKKAKASSSSKKKSSKKKSASSKTSGKKTSSKKTTKKKTTAKRSGTASSAPAYPSASGNGDGSLILDPAPTIAQLKKVKTGLSRKDLRYFEQLLVQQRAEIVGDVASLEGGVLSRDGGNLSNLPFHMADIGSDNYEHEFTLGLLESERKLLRDIDEALLRMRDGYYGVCIASAQPINRERLEAKPWARFTIEVAREKERRGEM